MRRVQLGLLVRSLKDGLSSRFQQPHSLRTLSTNALRAADEKDEKPSNNLFDSAYGSNNRGNPYPRRSSVSENSRGRSILGKMYNINSGMNGLGSKPDGMDETLISIQGGPAGKLEKATRAFAPADLRDGSAFGQDRNSVQGLGNRPGRANFRNRIQEKEVTTAEALSKADFRNTRFLAKFMTEGGIIMKRKQTGISAKAQRRIAREIKTARSFGLLPFTTQGTKAFVFGRTMQDHPDEYENMNFRGLGGYDTLAAAATTPDVDDD